MVLYRQEQSTSKGRHLVANAQIEAGTVILEERPLVASLYESASAQRCDVTCQSEGELEASGNKLLRCSRCKVALYSSTDAQRRAWNAYHQFECLALRGVAPKVPSATTLLASRLLWARQLHGNNPEFGKQWAAVEALQHHWDKENDERKQQHAQMAMLIRQYMSACSKTDMEQIDVKEVAKMLARFGCNVHTICDLELGAVGIGLYPTGALINHSCMPNAVQTFEGSIIRCTALAPIAPGSEITITYTELAATRQERRDVLFTQYHFDIDPKWPDFPTVEPGSAGCVGVEIMPENCNLLTCDGPPYPMDPVDKDLTTVTCGGRSFHMTGVLRLSQGLIPDAPQPQSLSGGKFAWDDINDHGKAAIIWTWGEHTSHYGPHHDLLGLAAKRLLAMLRLHHQLVAQLRGGQATEVAQITHILPEVLAAADDLAQSEPRVMLGPMHVWRMRLLEVALRVHIEITRDWAAALRTAQVLSPMYEKMFPKVWVAKGLHAATVAKLAHLVEDWEATKSAARTALQQLAYTHSDTSMYWHLEQMLTDAVNQQADGTTEEYSSDDF